MAAAFDLSVHGDLKVLKRNLSALAERHVRFATVQALTPLAKEVKAAEAQNIADTVENPRSFTINLLDVQGVRRDTLT